MFEARLARLQAALRDASLEAVALLPGASLRYLTGIDFHLYERPILGIFRAEADPILIVPGMEEAKVKRSSLPFETFTYSEDPSDQINAFTSAVSSIKGIPSALAVEPLSMRYYELNLVKSAAPDLELVDGSTLLYGLRARKDPEELEQMRRAVLTAESAIREVLPRVRIGMTEKEVAAELVQALYSAGSDLELPFHPIVASGPNSALPHATVTERPLSPGEFLLIDWGARVDGYCSDLTRTFALGEPDQEMKRVHAAVMSANRAGRDAIAPSITAGEIDRAGRAEIEAAGYGESFTHRIGHGLGLEAHEEPYIYPGSQESLAGGMTFTIEPGVYRRGWGGVRIEDDVVVTATGGRSLSSLERELKVIG
jgi:Xaa-Pro dipeptidase